MSILNYLKIFQMLTNAAVEFAVFNTTVIHYLHKGLLLFTCYSTDLELKGSKVIYSRRAQTKITRKQVDIVALTCHEFHMKTCQQ